MGWAVRRDWPDGGHEYVRFSLTLAEVCSFMERDRVAWRRGPVRPRLWTAVELSGREFELHRSRRLCRAPDCPASMRDAVDLPLGVDGSGVWR